MIRVLVLDDHPALQAGLQTVLRAEPGLVPVGTAANANELHPLLNRTRPDVVLVDYHVPPDDGLVLCRRIKATLPPPKVVIYSAYADTSLTIASIVAGADGLVHKGAPADELFDAIRRVVRGERVLPPVSAELMTEAAGRLDSEEMPIVGMLIDGTPQREIAEVLRLENGELAWRIDRIIARLKLEVPSASL